MIFRKNNSTRVHAHAHAIYSAILLYPNLFQSLLF